MYPTRSLFPLALLAATHVVASPLPAEESKLSFPPSLFDIEFNELELERLSHIARDISNGAHLSKRVNDETRAVLDDKDKFCGWNRETIQGAKDALHQTGALTYLGVFIDLKETMNNGEMFGLGGDPTDWLDKWEKRLFLNSSGTTGGDGCWDVGHECKPGGPLYGLQCSEYFDAGTKIMERNAEKNEFAAELLSDMVKTSYWLFEAVMGTHEKIRALLSRLFRQALITDLKIDEMVGRLAPEDESSAAFDIISSLSTAVGLVGAFAGLGSGPAAESVSAGTDIIGSILDAVSSEFEEEPEKFDTGSIRGALGSFVGKTEEYLERSLMLATGTRQPKSPGGITTKLDFWELPFFDAPGLFHKQPLAFYYNGYWLMGTADNEYISSLDNFRDNIQATVVHNIIKADGNFLYGDYDVSEEECNQMSNARWHHIAKRDRGFCFHLAKKTDYNYYEDVDEDIYAALKEYGIYDIGVYYKSIIECGNYLNSDRGEKKPKFSIGLGADIGKVPHCHFNLPVAAGKVIRCGAPNQVNQQDCIEPIDIDCDSDGKNCEG